MGKHDSVEKWVVGTPDIFDTFLLRHCEQCALQSLPSATPYSHNSTSQVLCWQLFWEVARATVVPLCCSGGVLGRRPTEAKQKWKRRPTEVDQPRAPGPLNTLPVVGGRISHMMGVSCPKWSQKTLFPTLSWSWNAGTWARLCQTDAKQE